MILFVPGYDAATLSNLAVAESLPSVDCISLLADQATQEALFDALAHSDRPVFSMSHGGPDQLRAQHGGTALGIADLERIGRRSIYAFACHTATRLGEHAAKVGATWWGYTGTIQCPDDSAPFRHLFVQIFDYIRTAFTPAETATDRLAVLLRLAQMCEDAQSEVDRLALDNPNLDVTPAFYCLLHIWDRLRIWGPEAAEPERHPSAQPPSLFWD